MDLPNKCFLVSTNSENPLLHTIIEYAIKFFFVNGTNEMLLTCHMCQFSISGHKAIKTTFYIEMDVYFAEINMWNFSNLYNLLGKDMN